MIVLMETSPAIRCHDIRSVDSELLFIVLIAKAARTAGFLPADAAEFTACRACAAQANRNNRTIRSFALRSARHFTGIAKDGASRTAGRSKGRGSSCADRFGGIVAAK
jgi:hypothetical protein